MAKLREIGLNLEQEGVGDPVILIHGVTLDLRMWSTQAPALSKYFRVIRYDLRGFGQSDDPSGPYSDRGDLNLLLDVLGIEKAHLVGLSRGGRVALEFAVQYSERVHSLVLINPGLRYKDKTFPQKDIDQPHRELALALIKEGKRQEACDAWLKTTLFQSPGQEVPRPEVERMVRDFFARTRVLEQFLPHSDLYHRDLKTIKIPSLILVGEHKLQAKPPIEDLRDNLRNCQYQPVPDAGHLANIDHPEFVNDALINFLNEAHENLKSSTAA
jgi:pimeloyl-ACP methyl ester carboxylesterase